MLAAVQTKFPEPLTVAAAQVRKEVWRVVRETLAAKPVPAMQAMQQSEQRRCLEDLRKRCGWGTLTFRESRE